MSYGEFQQPKPPKFSLIIPSTPDKTARIGDPEVFNKLLDQKLIVFQNTIKMVRKKILQDIQK